MGGGINKPGRTEFIEFWQIIWKLPYLLRLAFSAGMGGLIFGYITGIFYSALPHIPDDFLSGGGGLIKVQVDTGVLVVMGAMIGAGMGASGQALGRKGSILMADFFFFIGAVTMAVAQEPIVISLGMMCGGVGVGIASMYAPLYISESSPTRIRGALVSTSFLLIAGGQFLSYLISQASNKTPQTWRWMFGSAGFLALVQFALMMSLPESPRWLYRMNEKDEAVEILRKIYQPHEVDKEIEALWLSVEAEIAEEGSIYEYDDKRGKAWSNIVVRRRYIAGVSCQMTQQFVGISMVMYYGPTIVQLAGYTSNTTTLALPLIASGLNVLGSIVSIFFVDRYGRRLLLLISMFGVIVGLGLLFGVFHGAAVHSPCISRVETTLCRNNTYLNNMTSPDATSWNCMRCLKVSSDCLYSHGGNSIHPGPCLALNLSKGSSHLREHHGWTARECPTSFGLLPLVGLGLYIISYSSGVGTVPWIINSELYPLRYRGICGGLAASTNWSLNFVVNQMLPTLTETLGPANTILIFFLVSCALGLFIYLFVPETKGLPLEEIALEEMLVAKRSYKNWKIEERMPFKFWKKSKLEAPELQHLERKLHED